jgi:dienelactone hydrolase
MADGAMFDYDQQAPLDVAVASTDQRGGVTVQDITYASPKGGRVPAYLVAPEGPGPFAGLIFVHWGQGNREEFVEEAIALAPMGMVSLCLDAPHTRPDALKSPTYRPEEAPQEAEIQLLVDARRAVDLLIARPNIDPRRLGYVGHSYGATYGGVLAGVEHRIKAFVLMAGYVSLTNSYRTTSHPLIAEARARTPPERWDHYLRLLEPLDAIHYIGHAAPSALFFQFARQDEFITEQEALRYEQEASAPKLTAWYDCGHGFNDEARQDRARWLSQELGLDSIPGGV